MRISDWSSDVCSSDLDIGAIGLMDTPREAAKVALKRLREMGITRMIMISGDHQKVADAIAKDVGIDEAGGDLMPADTVASIKQHAGEAKDARVGERPEERCVGKEWVRKGRSGEWPLT